MNYIRELLYRPRKTDRSNMARFFFADENLTQVAAELDSFDGRKDPERCACLVNRLRNCQDKLLNICNKMIEELEPGAIKRSREFRAKYPDDIMNDNLAGQLWFGAECLAAGSSIMNKESESESMRPLAKAVTKSLEKVRQLLREQCLSPQPEYTEAIRENLKIFDRLFADFEFNYVRCMVHVKSAREYELHQDLIVLFSETLMHALLEDLIQQEAVDFCDPSLMFAIPRLSIVYGLLLSSLDGPLNVDRSSAEFPSLFLPFKNLLKKIRELLLTLEPSEVMVLEMLLCNLEEPAKISSKLKEVEHKLKERQKSIEGTKQAEKLQAKLTGIESGCELIEEKPERQHQCQQTDGAFCSTNTKHRKRSKNHKAKKHHSKREGAELLDLQHEKNQSAAHRNQKSISESTCKTDAPSRNEGGANNSNSSLSMLERVDSIPCVCDETFVSSSGNDCDNKQLSSDTDNVNIVAPIVNSLIATAVENSMHKLKVSTDSPCVQDMNQLTLSDKKDRTHMNIAQKEVEIDCTGPDIEIRVSPQRRVQEQRPVYTSQNSCDTQRSNINDNIQSSIRDYQQPSGRFSNGTYIPYVPSNVPPQYGYDSASASQPPVSHLNSTTRQPHLSTSLSGMGLPYQIPRPSLANSSFTYENSVNVSPVTHYYNDPYDVSGSTSHRVSLKRGYARRDAKRIPFRFQKDRRAKFKSTEDLLHRLYVCISGAADQLQSNYAGDFRSILRTVFLMNVTQDEEDPPQKVHNMEDMDDDETNLASQEEIEPSRLDVDNHLGLTNGIDGTSMTGESVNTDTENTGTATASADRSNRHMGESDQNNQTSRNSPPSVLPSDTLQYDIATDAIQHEGIVSMYAQHLGPNSETRGSMNASLVAGANWDEAEVSSNNFQRDASGGAVYARNLDWAQQLRDVQGQDIEQGAHLVVDGSIIHNTSAESSISNFSHGTITRQTEFYQPEPALLDIARGAHAEIGNPENLVSPTSPDTTDLKFGSLDVPSGDGPPEISAPEAEFYPERTNKPPAWIPDDAVTECMGCRDSFTLLRRRHHCRNCGQVFCGRCSSQSTPLPHFKLDRPVRVCNRCFVIIGHQHSTDLFGTSPRSPSEYNHSSPNMENSNSTRGDDIRTSDVPETNPSNTLESAVPNARQNFYARNFGMVS